MRRYAAVNIFCCSAYLYFDKNFDYATHGKAILRPPMTQQSFDELKSLGDLFYKAKKWEQALQAYDEAAEIDVNDDLHFKRGFALFQLKRIDEAQDAYELCLADNEKNYAAWFNLALCHDNLENWEEARDAYRAAIELSPESTKPWEGLALCAENLGDKALRIEVSETLARLLPDSSHWLNEVGRAHINSGESTGVWKAKNAFLKSARLNNDPCHPSNAALAFRKLNKWLDAADSYCEALHRKPGYAFSEKGLEEITPRLEKLSEKVRCFAASIPPCKNPYERYLNPFDILAVRGPLTEMPEGAALRKLIQRAIHEIQANDGHADWLEGVELVESRVRQVLDDLDDIKEPRKLLWHWIIYQCPKLNRFLSHGDPLFFAFFTPPSAQPEPQRPPYWQLRDKSLSEEAFFEFIHAPFLTSFEALLGRALDLNDAELVQAFSSGRLPTVDAFDYFRGANKWLETMANQIKGYVESLSKSEGINYWKQTTEPMSWFSVTLTNALPEECKNGRTEIGRALRILCLKLHNDHGLTDQALQVVDAASQLLVDTSLVDQLKKDKSDLEDIARERKKQETETARWNIVVKIRSDEIEINKAFIRYNDSKIPAESINGIRFGIFKQYTNGIPTSTSYLIQARSLERNISIECKRVFRSEEQAKKDFSEILTAISHQIIPALVIGIAEKIVAGKSEHQVGSLLLTRDGIKCETGSLWWKKQLIVPYSALSFTDYQGNVHVSAKQPEAINFALDRREVWNAVIIEKIVEFIQLMQS
jgi:tetratricopeptide (TPR) repeat protein